MLVAVFFWVNNGSNLLFGNEKREGGGICFLFLEVRLVVVGKNFLQNNIQLK